VYEELGKKVYAAFTHFLEFLSSVLENDEWGRGGHLLLFPILAFGSLPLSGIEGCSGLG